MRNQIVMLFLVIVLAGCGSASGSSQISSGVSAAPGNGKAKSGLVFTLSRIGTDQVIPTANLLRCEVENQGASDKVFGGFKGRFISTNPRQTLINFDLMIDGRRELVASAIDSTRPVTMPVTFKIAPGKKAFVYLLTNPHALHVGEFISFEVDEVIVDGKSHQESLKPSVVCLNRGGFSSPDFYEVPQFIPWSSVPKDVIVYHETLFPTTTREQSLYDYEFRFRSGRRNQGTSLAIGGNAQLQVSPHLANQWRTVDALPIHGHHVSVHYKFAFFGETLSIAKDVRIVLNLDGYVSGDHFLVDRTTIGGDTGFLNYPTRFGPTFRCN